MGFSQIYRFLIRGFIPLLLVSCVQLSTTNFLENDVQLPSGFRVEANHLRSLGRIVNGSVAILGQFPHQVSLRNTLTGRHFCGGNIIDAEWILTAAHCMFRQSGAQIQPWLITVVAGDLWLNRTSTTSQQSAVSQIVIHENYDSLTLENDITLLKLAKAFTFGDPAVEYQLLQINPVSAGTICQVAGWGYPAADVPLVTNELMYVDVPMVSQTLCRELYVKFSDISDGMICAGYIEGSRDACQGDSGGGLICDGKLTGIVSWGEGCAQPQYPGVYSDVRFFRNWIFEQLGNDFRIRNGANRVGFSLWVKMLSIAVIGLVTTS